jgi:hypothetical protein
MNQQMYSVFEATLTSWQEFLVYTHESTFVICFEFIAETDPESEHTVELCL